MAVAASLVSVALAGAAFVGAPSGVVLVDDAGRTVRVPPDPARIVSTAPSNTEALFALGAGDRVVGVTNYCDFPPEARSRARVGDFSSVDLESVVALRPDLVVATWLEQRRAVERMAELGLTVLVLYPTTLEETFASLALLGRAVGAEDRAASLAADLRRRLAAIDARVRSIPAAERPRVFVELNASPLYTAGPGSTVHEAIERAGGRNVAADLGKPYATIAREVVLARDPEVILSGMTGTDADGAAGGKGAAGGAAATSGLATVSAVRTGRVHEVDPGLLFHQNHRLVDGIEHLFRLFHPARSAEAADAPASPP